MENNNIQSQNRPNGRNNNGVIQIKPNLKFIKQPFYEVYREVIKPTLLSKLPKLILL